MGQQCERDQLPTGSASNDTTALIHSLEELADDEGNRLDALHLLLSTEKLLAEVLGLITNVVLVGLASATVLQPTSWSWRNSRCASSFLQVV